MAQSLRRQKKFLQKTIDRLLAEGIYLRDAINSDNYRIKIPAKKQEVLQDDIPKVREYLSYASKSPANPTNEQNIEQFKGFPDRGTGDYYDASLKPESKPLFNEFDDDFYDGYFNVRKKH